MVLKRLMPCLLFDGEALLKTVNFKNANYIGDPINAIKIYNEKEVDELVVLDIMATKERRGPLFGKIKDMASECFMPFAYGGGVSTIEDFRKLYTLGVEKVVVNTLLFTNPEVVNKAVTIFGSQSVVASVDVKKDFFGRKKVFSYSGQKSTKSIKEFCKYLNNDIGVGEIFLSSVDREGTWSGFDFELVSEVADDIPIPIIAHGGCGSEEDLTKVLYDSQAHGAALGSMAVYQKKGMGVLIKFPQRGGIIKE